MDSTYEEWQPSSSIENRISCSKARRAVADALVNGGEWLSPNAKRVNEKISEIEETVEIHERDEIIGLVYQDYINKKKKPRNLTDDFLSASPHAVLQTHHRDTSHSQIRSSNGWVPFCFPTNANVYNVGEAWDELGPAMVMKRTFAYSKSTKNPQQWISRSIMCYQKGCSFQAKLDSEDSSMSCRKFVLSSNGQHNHDVINWCKYYKYRTDFYTNKNTTQKQQWNSSIYPLKPGVPKFIVAEIEKILKSNPTIRPKDASSKILNKYATHPLFVFDDQMRKYLNNTIQKTIASRKQTNTTTLKMKYVFDILTFKETYVLHTLKIFQKLPPSIVLGDRQLTTYSQKLKQMDLLHGKMFVKSEEHELPHRSMIILDDPSIEYDKKYIDLVASKSHTTGVDARATTIVFTSIALLANICWCQKMDWCISASADGTHNISNNSYKLIMFGVYNISVDGKRQFYTIACALGEGEREIVTLLLLMNVKIACYRLFGITIRNFKGGCISDHSTVFTKPFQYLFYLQLCMTCKTHILRKVNTAHVSVSSALL